MRSHVIFPSMLVVWISVVLQQAHSSLFTPNIIEGSGTSDEPMISKYASKLFKKCHITDLNTQVSILEKGKKNFNEKILTIDREYMEPEAQSWSLNPSDSNPMGSTSLSSKSEVEDSKGNVNLISKNLSQFSLKRQKGYIVFEDGENDDYLQNYLGYLYDDRIPEMIIICRGYSKLRLKMCEKFWEMISNEHQCEIPQILMGAQGKRETKLFDIMEGVGVIDETERQRLIEASLDFQQREIEAKETYRIVTDHILTLNKVSIALKTAPTDLYEIVKLLGLEIAREKMIIGWASPAGFVEKPDGLHIFAKFNFEQDYEASYDLISSEIPMYLTGKSLSDTRTKAFIAKEHVIKMREVDEKFEGFKGFENLIETFKSAKTGGFLHLYLNVQRAFQNARVYFAKKTIEYLNELSNKNHPIKDIKVDQEALKSKFAIEYFEKMKQGLEKSLGNYPTQDHVKSKIKKIKQRHEKSVKRWGSLFEGEDHFVEGCVADPHLEFILNSTLRKESVKEIIPVKLSKKLGVYSQHDIYIEIQPESNCWLLSGVDDTHFVEILQDFINRSNKNVGTQKTV
ncbi:uncharacterized protein MELLADRAFT_113756 [Melampsora larici-populina 98AG31]|uniref:Secreted protein n=1 Tax=Melampsora larici-populina (strain 98AG31 / pathotype 3-4-7) TaxID=747676 RepID=F4SAZ2_MELLP|nr:uncharacterized protein MELLADRAFT_113756 [Melampsora larici-populina 98AG31]EGF98190.1 hypothetical protein MELLADRAFT_113756 [Melampsora larici-populina 98AG31]